LNHVKDDHTDQPDRPSLYIGRDASNGHGVMFAIDLRQMWGAKGLEKWKYVSDARGRNHPGGFFPESAMERAFAPLDPVPADRLVYNALHGPIYPDLIETADSEPQHRRKLGI